jgi:hypothetical protein
MSHGSKLKNGGRGSGGRGNNIERSRPWVSQPKTGVFMLQKSSTATTTNNFLGAIKDWANVELMYGVGDLARPHQPGEIRFPVEPIRPDHDDMNDVNEFVYGHRNDEGHGDELNERGLRTYKEDFDLYKSEKSAYDKMMREIDAEKYKLHGKLEANLSLDARTALEKIYTTNIWTDKDPEALIEAIKTVFVGQLAGGGDSRASRAIMKHDFDHITRANGESQMQFARRFNDSIESYRHAEIQAGEIAEAELDALLNERELSRRYITACGLESWLWSLRYDAPNEPWPDTVAAAIKRANEFEEGLITKGQNPYGKPNQEFDLYQAFLAQQKKNNGKGQSKGNQGKFQPTGQSKQADNGPCHSYHNTGTCAWGASHPNGPDCKFSHKTNNGSTNIGAMTSAAVGQVNGQKAVAFQRNPDVGGGGTGFSTTSGGKGQGNG